MSVSMQNRILSIEPLASAFTELPWSIKGTMSYGVRAASPLVQLRNFPARARQCAPVNAVREAAIATAHRQ